jgi:hypothetical protein
MPSRHWFISLQYNTQPNLMCSLETVSLCMASDDQHAWHLWWLVATILIACAAKGVCSALAVVLLSF